MYILGEEGQRIYPISIGTGWGEWDAGVHPSYEKVASILKEHVLKFVVKIYNEYADTEAAII